MREKQIYYTPEKQINLLEFWEYYASVEIAVKLKPDEFIKNAHIRNETINGIKGLAKIIIKRGEELLKKRGVNNDIELSVSLVSLKVISGSVSDELSELLTLVRNIDNLDLLIVYSNLVRFIEVFEEVYLAIEDALTESK
ncbi:MAG: hypothetical protein QXW39_09430 [Candidatus Bathyarchaeia archaeon]